MSMFILYPYLENQIATRTQSVSTGYPPTDIYYQDTDSASPDIIIDMALAGFSRKDVSVSVNANNELVIEGQLEKPATTPTMIHRGISRKSFSRQFKLTQGSTIKSCTLTDGILTVVITPEKERPPLQIPIK